MKQEQFDVRTGRLENVAEPIDDRFGTPSRRAIVGAGCAVALGAVAMGAGLGLHVTHDDPYTDDAHGRGDSTDSYTAEDVILSMCNGCNTSCPIKVRICDAAEDADGATTLLRKISGNPYSPLNTQPYAPIPYETSPHSALVPDGSFKTKGRSASGGVTCLKGQAGIQIAHNALRVTEPLRRVGKRGEDAWESVSWDTALDEIIGGSSALGTPGISSWWAYAPKEKVEADVELMKSGSMSKQEFDDKWRDTLIDVDHPDLGPKSNLLCSFGSDRGFINSRFVQKGLGTINTYGHGGVCGFTGAVSNARTHPTTGFNRMYPEIDYCECLIIWGTEPMTANKGPTWFAPRLSVARARGMKLFVVDPRQGRSGTKADLWLPVIPGKDTELAFAMASWILANERYDERYLSAPGKKAADAIGEPTWSDATHLVAIDLPNRPVVTARLLGLVDDGIADDARFVFVDGELVLADEAEGAADLRVDAEIEADGTTMRVKSVFSLLEERINERSIEYYAEECGIDVSTIEEVAREFTSHGKRSAITSYRGPCMHTNGYDAIRAINYLNFLIGNNDWKGGNLASGAKFETNNGRYDLVSVPGGYKPWGIAVSRHNVPYEKTSYFEEDGYPAKRLWLSLSTNLIQEVVPTLRAGYIYDHLGALFMHRYSLVDSAPGGDRMADVLTDTEKIKLIVAFDVEIGDTARYADFILPDRTFLERFTQEGIYPTQPFKLLPLGQPTTRVFDGPRPTEAVYIELLKRMGKPGVGEGAIPKGKNASDDAPSALDSEYDYWMKLVANVAYSGEPVPDADADELELFEKVRSRALRGGFDIAQWKAAVTPEEWPKVVYVLNRGGRFAPADRLAGDGFEGEWLQYRYGALCAFYDPKTAATKDALSGKNHDGLAHTTPITYADGTEVEKPREFPLAMITWKARANGTYRLMPSSWLREVETENFVWMSPSDAFNRGLENGDAIEISSSTGIARGHVKVTEGIRPGVVGSSYSFGHQGSRAYPIVVDGITYDAAPDYLVESRVKDGEIPGHQETGLAGGRNRGFRHNALLPDDVLEGGGGLMDRIGGGAAQLDLWVEIKKA